MSSFRSVMALLFVLAPALSLGAEPPEQKPANQVPEIPAPVPAKEYSPRQLASAERTLFDSMQLDWYQLEFIIFERLNVLAFNSKENLLTPVAPHFPHAALELIDAQASPRLSRDPDWYEDDLYCQGYAEFNDRPPNRASVTRQAPKLDSPKPTQVNAPTPLDPRERAIQQLRNDLAEFEQTLIDRSLIALEERELETEVKLINRRRYLRPLLHMSWLQAAQPRNQPTPVEVVYAEANLPTKLHAYMALTKGRYLHLRTDLRYTVPGLGWHPTAVTPGVTSPLATHQTIQLKQSRRMRSGELHYMDHPKLGVIAKAEPVKLPATLVRSYLDLGRPSLAD